MFDYLDAGLGLLLHDQLRFMYRTYSPYGIAYDASRLLKSADLKAELMRRPDRSVFERARRDLSIERNIGRLTRFYGDLT